MALVDARKKGCFHLIKFSHFMLHARHFNFLFGCVSLYMKHKSEIWQYCCGGSLQIKTACSKNRYIIATSCLYDYLRVMHPTDHSSSRQAASGIRKHFVSPLQPADVEILPWSCLDRKKGTHHEESKCLPEIEFDAILRFQAEV